MLGKGYQSHGSYGIYIFNSGSIFQAAMLVYQSVYDIPIFVWCAICAPTEKISSVAIIYSNVITRFIYDI